MDREKIIEKLEKEVKRTYAIKSAVWECGENGYKKIGEEVTEHREPFVTLTIEMTDKILALLKEQVAVVHCKDCKHWNADEHDCNIKIGWFACGADWFCADGKRQEVKLHNKSERMK